MNLKFKTLVPALGILTGIAITGLSIGSALIGKTSSSELIEKILKGYENLNQRFPQERVYLHLDKPFYKPGEAIWFRAYLRNGHDFTSHTQSDILHVDLINPKGSIEKHIELICKKGMSDGDFQLSENVAGGLYKIRAYTNWQKNEPSELVFEKEIQIQSVVLPTLKMKMDFDKKAFGSGDRVSVMAEFATLENKKLASKEIKYIVNLGGNKFLEDKTVTDAEGNARISFSLPQNLASNDGLLNILLEHEGNSESISRSIPIVLNKVSFEIFPEGGDLVAGLSTNVAFRALNEFGKPADVIGFIEDSKGNRVAEFQSYHQGMGAFPFKPQAGEKYYAKISKPANISQKYELPETFNKGYILNIENVKSSEIVLNVASTQTENLTVIGTVRDKICYTEQVNISSGQSKLNVSTEKFPIGVARFTLFDSRGIERAERLAFVNKDKQLKMKIETDKEKYLPREKVKLTVKVTDDQGIPMPGNFSLSVADDKLISFADDKSGNILSKMLLEYDIKEKVEEPSFYFNPDKAKANQALDYLLMTAGWRRFTWEQILENDLPSVKYNAEKSIIAGTVIDASTGSPVSNVKIEVLGKNIFTHSDNNGHYSFEKLDLSEPLTLTTSANGFTANSIALSEYNANLNLNIYKVNYYNYYKHPISKTHVNAVIPQAAPQREIKRKFEADEFLPEVAEVADENMVIKQDKSDELKKEKIMAEGVVADRRLAADTIFIEAMANVIKPQPGLSKYYRARQFPSPVYDKNEPVEVRTDFRSTIYWNGNIETDRTGKAIVEFYNSDEITSFRITTEGISTDGMLGRSEKVYYTQLPFSMSVKCPSEFTSGDSFSLPLTLKNNTNQNISGSLNIDLPEGIKTKKTFPSSVTVEPASTKTILLECEASSMPGKNSLKVSFKSSGFNDAFNQEVNILPKGFPVTISLSGKHIEKDYEVNISNLVEGSMDVKFTAYPSVMTDLLKGIESIIREPYGCFEQTSTSNYPNVLIKQYIEETGDEAPGGGKRISAPSNLEANLEKGYARLISFETKEKGYEWFGGTPAHEALTAYGLMEFIDMKKVYNVDNAMINRTADWLLSRRDGNGGFKKSSKALDQFGRASDDITNAYIVYALSEAGYKDIMKEADKAFEKAVTSKDPYQIVLVANTMFNLKDLNKAYKMIKMLELMQETDGSWNGSTQSITCSQGLSLKVETTSLAVMALLKAGTEESKINEAVKFVVSSRSGFGGFGSTQGTVLALKALTAYAIHSKRVSEDGIIEIKVDGKKVAEKAYKAGDTGEIIIADLAQHLNEGKHRIKVKFIGTKEPLPYSIGVNYSTNLPKSSKYCKVEIVTNIKVDHLKTGETCRLTATIKNTTQEGLPMTMGIIGIPAGLSPQPWQLKELQEKQLIDFYEVRENNVFLYFRQMLPIETKNISLDLKAEIPGSFEAPASSAYLYYTNEFKSWSKPQIIEIKN